MKGFSGESMTVRRAGLLLPLFSVPGNQGIGDLGQKTLRMIDHIAEAGYSIWQILPIQAMGPSHSPYESVSCFAGDPIYINIDRLSEMSLLTQSSIVNCNKFKDFVNYDEVRAFKEVYFRKAFRNFKKFYGDYQAEFKKFKEEAFWLEDWTRFALFRSLYENEPWNKWEEEYRDFPLDHSNVDLKEHADELLYLEFLQFIFYKQLDEVVAYAKEKGVRLMGDAPFYLLHDSAEVWSDRSQFLLDQEGKLSYVGGCMPEKFRDQEAEKFVLYDFKKQKAEEYSFWQKRMRWLARYYEIIRIEPFSAMDTYWRIPAEATTVRDGKWIIGPRGALIEMIEKAIPSVELVAQDLDALRPEVKELEDQYGIPGMDVLLSRLDTKGLKRDVKINSVVYTTTHDMPTIEEEYATFDGNKRIALRRFFKKRGYGYRSFHDMVCAFALESKANTVILPLQDVCGYKGNTRIDAPEVEGASNWTWKLKDFKTFPDDLMKSREWIEASGRLKQNG